jgi:hypothetical protein
VDEIPAQEPAIGDTGRNASLPGFPSFGLRNAFTESYAKSGQLNEGMNALFQPQKKERKKEGI